MGASAAGRSSWRGSRGCCFGLGAGAPAEAAACLGRCSIIIAAAAAAITLGCAGTGVNSSSYAALVYEDSAVVIVDDSLAGACASAARIITGYLSLRLTWKSSIRTAG